MENDLVTPQLHATKSALDQVSGSVCLAKWLQVTMHLHSGNTHSCHHVAPHRMNLKESEKRPEALHNTAAKMKSRQKMLNGQRPRECKYCWAAEDRGRLSDRVIKSSETWARPFLDEVVESGVGPSIIPRYLEVSFDFKCNFRCMYCGPAFSSSWLDEVKALGPYPTVWRFNNLFTLHAERQNPLPENKHQRYIATFWKWWPDAIKKVEHFRITGGEPFLSKETFKVFEWLIANPQPQLQFNVNTNMSLSPDKLARVIDLTNQLEGKVYQFTLFTSIDCVGEQAEYIRYGLDYVKFTANVERLLTEVKTQFCLAYMITVNALCLPGLKDLLSVIVGQRRRYPHHRIAFDAPYLQSPKHLSVGILTADFAKYVDQALAFMSENMETADRPGFTETEIVKVSRIKSMIETPASGKTWTKVLRRDFFKTMNETDRRRKLDFAKTFPEYRDFMALCAGENVPV